MEIDAALLALAPESAKRLLLETMREAVVYDDAADRLWQTFEQQAIAAGRMAQDSKQALHAIHRCKADADKALSNRPVQPAHEKGSRRPSKPTASTGGLQLDGLFERVAKTTPARAAPPSRSSLLERGQRVLYFASDGRQRRTTIQRVHHDVVPYYTILLDGKERSTERDRLAPISASAGAGAESARARPAAPEPAAEEAAEEEGAEEGESTSPDVWMPPMPPMEPEVRSARSSRAPSPAAPAAQPQPSPTCPPTTRVKTGWGHGRKKFLADRPSGGGKKRKR